MNSKRGGALARSNNEYDRKILRAIASGQRVTQRSISSDMGVALGLTNLLIRRLVAKGYVKVAGIGTRHIRYLMTAAGWDALGTATRKSLMNTVHLYTETREHIWVSLSEVATRCPVNAAGEKPVVFYGAGDVAEIAYVSLQRTDLKLVGIIDDKRTGRFFDLTIAHSDELKLGSLKGVPYHHLIITSMQHAEEIRARLDTRLVPHSMISGLEGAPL